MTILIGDAREQLATLPSESIQTCVTSPPYFQLRDYNVPGQIGLETTVDEYVSNLVDVFREVRRVLKDDGTLWLNLASSYGAEKQMIPVPWLVALALQTDGWILRQDIIWSKLNPLPESVKDRCTKSHEYIFLFSKKPKYYFDAEAIAEPTTANVTTSIRFGGSKYGDSDDPKHATKSGNVYEPNGKRNKRSVWTIATKPFKEAHFATFPPDLVTPCILAGSREGDTVLDPFGGSGTTGLVADRNGREFVLIELNPDYALMARNRIDGDAPLFRMAQANLA